MSLSALLVAAISVFHFSKPTHTKSLLKANIQVKDMVTLQATPQHSLHPNTALMTAAITDTCTPLMVHVGGRHSSTPAADRTTTAQTPSEVMMVLLYYRALCRRPSAFWDSCKKERKINQYI